MPNVRQLLIDTYDMLLNSWDTEFEEKDIETRYGLTHVIIAGNCLNPPLLLFHGTADNSAMMWIYNVKELSKYFHIIAVDTIRGSGKSEPIEEYNKNFNQVNWIDDILNALEIPVINICGFRTVHIYLITTH